MVWWSLFLLSKQEQKRNSRNHAQAVNGSCVEPCTFDVYCMYPLRHHCLVISAAEKMLQQCAHSASPKGCTKPCQFPRAEEECAVRRFFMTQGSCDCCPQSWAYKFVVSSSKTKILEKQSWSRETVQRTFSSVTSTKHKLEILKVVSHQKMVILP